MKDRGGRKRKTRTARRPGLRKATVAALGCGIGLFSLGSAHAQISFNEGDLLVGTSDLRSFGGASEGVLYKYDPVAGNTQEVFDFGTLYNEAAVYGMSSVSEDGIVYVGLMEEDDGSTNDFGRLVKFNLSSQSVEDVVWQDSGRAVRKVRTAPDGRIVFNTGWWDEDNGGDDGEVRIYDPSTDSVQVIEDVGWSPYGLELSPDGSEVFFGAAQQDDFDGSQEMRLYEDGDLSTSTQASNDRNTSDLVEAIHYDENADDGTYIVGLRDRQFDGSEEGEIRRWNPDTGQFDLIANDPSSEGIAAIEFAPDGTVYVGIHDIDEDGLNDDDGGLRTIDLNTGAYSNRLFDPSGGFGVTALQTTPFIFAFTDEDTVDPDPAVDGTSFNLTIAASGAGVSGTTDFRSTVADGTLAALTLQGAIIINPDVTVWADDQGGNVGDLTVDEAIDFDNGGTTDSTLQLAAANTVTINESITDSATGDNDKLNLDIEAGSDSVVGPNADDDSVFVNAAINTGAGDIEIEGKNFNNTGATPGDGTITTTGNVDLDFEEAITIGSEISGDAVSVETVGTGDVTANAALNAAGQLELDADDGNVVVNSGATLTSGGLTVLQSGAGNITVGEAITSVGMITEGTDLTLNAAVDAGVGTNPQGAVVELRQTGAVDLNAALSNAKSVKSEGTTFDNAGGVITATESVDLEHSGAVLVNAAINSEDFSSTGADDFTANAELNATGQITLAQDGAVAINAKIDGDGTTAPTSFSSTGAGTFTTDAAADITTSGAFSLTHDGAMTLNGDLNAASLSTSGLGDFDSSAADVDVSGDVTLDHQGTTSIGTLAAGNLNLTRDALFLAGDIASDAINLDGNKLSIGGSASIEVDPSGVTTGSGGDIDILGGRFAGPAASYVNFFAGTFADVDDLTINPGSDIENVLGTTPTIDSGKELEVAGATTLQNTLVLDGGTLTTGSLIGSQNLDFQGGVINLTGSGLSVTAGGAFGDVLQLTQDQQVNVSGTGNTITVASDGVVSVIGSGAGLTSAAGITNNGVIQLNDELAEIGGAGTLTNNGTLEGTGRILSGAIVNNDSIRAENGAEMFFGGDLQNASGGTITVIDGQAQFEGTVVNQTGGSISGQDGVMRFDDIAVNPNLGLAGLQNAGELRVSGGASNNVFGSIFQEGDGARIIVTGGATANFFGDVFNYDTDTANPGGEAELRVSGGSAAVFLGTYKGAGDITGPGTIFFEGVFDGGQSPGKVNIEGSIGFGADATTIIELAGYTPGQEFDVINVGGSASLDGLLSVQTLDGFNPQIGDTFEVLTAGNLSGQFAAYDFGDALFETSYDGNTLTLTTIPEPTTGLLLGAGLLGLLPRRRRGKRTPATHTDKTFHSEQSMTSFHRPCARTFGRGPARPLAALGFAASALALAPAANAQEGTNPLEFGDLITINTFMNSTQSGRIYRIDTDTGARAQIGSDWTWTDRPTAFYIEDPDNLIVASGTHDNESSSYDPALWRVNISTGNRTQLTTDNTFLGQRGTNYRNQIGDMVYDSERNQVYLGTGYLFWSQRDEGRYWKVTPGDWDNTQWMVDTNDSNRPINFMALSNDGETLYTHETFHSSSPNGYFMHLDPDASDFDRTFKNNFGWPDRIMSFIEMSDGTAFAYEGDLHSSTTNSLREFDLTNGQYITQRGPSNPFGSTNLVALDMVETSDGTILMAVGDHDDTGQRAELWEFDPATNSFSEVHRNLDGSTDMFNGWTDTPWKMDALIFGLRNSFKNDITIGTTSSSVDGDPFFFSTDSDATVDVSEVLTALASGDAGVRAGWSDSGANNQDGDVTVAQTLDIDGADGNTLEIRAHDDLVFNASTGVSDSDGGTADSINLVLASNNDSGGTTGLTDVNAAIDIGSGELTASGKAFDNTGGTIDAGDVSLNYSDSAVLGAAVTAANFTSNGAGTLQIDAALTSADAVTINQGGDVSTTAEIDATGDVDVTAPNVTLGADVTAANFSASGSGVLDATGVTIDATGGTITLSHAGGSNLGDIVADTLDVNGVVGVQGTADVATLDIGANNVQLGIGSELLIDSLTTTTGKIQLVGGRYQAETSLDAVEFITGTFSDPNDLVIAPNEPIENVIGTSPSLTAGQELEVAGETNLLRTLLLDGGTLTTGSIVGANQLDFQDGVVNLTGSSLSVANGGTFGRQLELQAGQQVNLSGTGNTVTIASDGIVSLEGVSAQLNSEAGITNNGTISLNDKLASVGGVGTLTNAGTLKGVGRVMSDVVVNNDLIEVQAGDSLFFGGNVTNNAQVNFTGGDLEFEGPVVNASSGTIAGTDGTLRFDNITVLPGVPSAGLVNEGTVSFSGDNAGNENNVFGSIFQQGDDAKIIVTGGTLTTFFGDVYNYDADTANPGGEAEVRVNGGSAAVFFGTYKGAGDITGQGTTFFEGTVDLGQSPSAISIEGSVGFGEDATTIIELAGLTPGQEFDAISIGGSAELDGLLSVELLDGFKPSLGDTFEVLTAGNLVGEFAGYDFGGAQLEASYSGNSLTLTAVPEPATGLLLAGGAFGLLARRRRSA